MGEVLTAVAPAKVNLVLEVLGRRDDGYHEIDTVLQTLQVADRVSIANAGPDDPRVEVTGPWRSGVPADASNLAWKAVMLLAERLKRDASNLRILLEKHIPAAGGLGGGSSDAVTILR
ncbi:MAG: 4-(cytidine 5'-diphospho)-2-C-methyl-D-erythritol kinase, partial [Dehalococcoidia bacterium]|nr:4-(cytidine 5'-diphospho)-2-C-methyl-D-erythritol kinase [Dehalococcoidia bacterium]